MSLYISFVVVDESRMLNLVVSLLCIMCVFVFLLVYNEWDGYFGMVDEFQEGDSFGLLLVNLIFRVEEFNV